MLAMSFLCMQSVRKTDRSGFGSQVRLSRFEVYKQTLGRTYGMSVLVLVLLVIGYLVGFNFILVVVNFFRVPHVPRVLGCDSTFPAPNHSHSTHILVVYCIISGAFLSFSLSVLPCPGFLLCMLGFAHSEIHPLKGYLAVLCWHRVDTVL